MAANDKPNHTVNCRISRFQDETIEALKNSGVLGDERADVVRALLQIAIERLEETGRIKNLKEWKKGMEQ